MARRKPPKATRHVAYSLAWIQFGLTPRKCKAILTAHDIQTVNDTNILQVMTLFRRYRRHP